MKWNYSQDMECIRCADNTPLIFSSGNGAFLFDVNNKNYIDFCNGFGSVLLGYNDADVNNAIKELVCRNKTSLNVPTDYFVKLQNILIKDFTQKESLALFNNGTSALRAAALITQEFAGKKIIMSSGYHGWDPMWHKTKVPFAPNDYGVIDFFFVLEKLEELICTHKNLIASVIISPDITYFSETYYRQLFDICHKNNIMIVLDEVKTGYRYNSASCLDMNKYEADVYIVSKGLANGSKISCIISNKDILSFSQEFCFTSYFEPLSAAIAVATLSKLNKQNVQSCIATAGNKFIENLKLYLGELNLPIEIRGNGNLFQFIFADDKASNIFYSESINNGLRFFNEDNQCLSFAFDENVCNEALERTKKVIKILDEKHPGYTNMAITNERIALTAYNQVDGIIEDLPINQKYDLINKLYEN